MVYLQVRSHIHLHTCEGLLVQWLARLMAAQDAYSKEQHGLVSLEEV